MIIKNLKKYFTFEVQVLDDKNVRRRFRASNYQVRIIIDLHFAPLFFFLFAFIISCCYPHAVVNQSETIHLHHAHASGRWMESNSI